jgi:MtN3 and saliva related transmembrane protein
MKEFIEVLFSLALFINAVLFVPQALTLFKTKNSADLSFITFFGFLLIQLVTVIHGVLRKDYLLTLGTSLSMLTCGLVTSLIVYYRAKSR